MRTLREHILEKLKVSTKETPMMTNREFFELLREYTNIINTVHLMTGKLFGYDQDDMPKYSKDKTRYIESIHPYTGGHDQIILQLKDVYEGRSRGYVEVNVEQDGDDIVDFTDDDSLTKIIEHMKHMQESIKK